MKKLFAVSALLLSSTLAQAGGYQLQEYSTANMGPVEVNFEKAIMGGTRQPAGQGSYIDFSPKFSYFNEPCSR